MPDGLLAPRKIELGAKASYLGHGQRKPFFVRRRRRLPRLLALFGDSSCKAREQRLWRSTDYE
jgi:hypothetical protein